MSRRLCSSCGEPTTHQDRKYCSRECAPFGHFVHGGRKKGPIEYFSRARLEIERLQEENRRLRCQLEGRECDPPLDPNPHPCMAVRQDKQTVWVAKHPRFHRQKRETRTLEERALELLRELYGPGYKPNK
jgi:hypothetical protein